MRNSKYWDDFEKRIPETVDHINFKTHLRKRRIACFITEICNFNCKYCNHKKNGLVMKQHIFENMLEKYGRESIIHITGGEPSTVSWLYDFIERNGKYFRFHLNTNAYIKPPYENIKRLKISLDSTNRNYWNELVGRNAFDKVVENIKEASDHTLTSITYTLTKQNYKNVIDFANFCNINFPKLYAIFFSIYKGNNKNFILNEYDVDLFFTTIIPELIKNLNEESKNLLLETIDEKRRLLQGIRFEQNMKNNICYISMSECVIDPSGNEFTCSHLYRDNVLMKKPYKHEKCRYGCNRRLVAFNEEVERILKIER